MGKLRLAAPASDGQEVPDTYKRNSNESFRGASLQQSCSASIAIVGGGITGCAAALVLAEQGLDVVVLEARHVGAGASGRSFGQVVPYSKHDHRWAWARFGVERGDAIIDFIGAGPDVVFSLIEQHGIECEAERGGTLLAVHHHSKAASLRATAEFWRARGAPVELVTGAEVAALSGSKRYDLAMLDSRGGTLNVFAYVQGLARAATAAGARVFEHCAVTDVAPTSNGAWRLNACGVEVVAKQVIFATNAYADGLWPALRQAALPMRGYGLVTSKLPAPHRETILPHGHSLTDTRRLFSGIRMRSDGRLNVSADGPPFRIGKADREKARRRLLATYPELDGIEFEEEWAGWIAITPSQFPGMHRLAEGVWAALGYSGRGIAMATLLGRELAHELIAHELIRERNRPGPLAPSKLPRIPTRSGAALYAQALVSLYRLLDRRDLKGIE